MAHVSGKTGSITFTNLTLGIKSWSLNYTADAIETTDFADSGKRTYLIGLTGGTATAEGFWDPGNTAVPGAGIATLTLTADTTATADTYAASAIMTGMVINVAVDGVNTATFTFQLTGTITATLSA